MSAHAHDQGEGPSAGVYLATDSSPIPLYADAMPIVHALEDAQAAIAARERETQTA